MSKPDSFSLWLLQVLILSILLIFFLWLSLRPSSPSYSIIDFSIPVSANNVTNSSISVIVEFSNNNKGGRVYYDNINISIYSGKDSISSTSLPSFYQGHEKGTLVTGTLAANGRTWEEMVVFVLNKTAEVKVGLATVVRYKIWWWRSRRHWMYMEAGVPVGVNGKLSWKKKNKKKIKMHKAHKKWRF